MSEQVHHVAGRLRVRVPELKNCSSKVPGLQSVLGAVRGVRRVEYRPTTGSLIIHYLPGVADVDSVLRILACNAPAVQSSARTVSTDIRNKLLRAALSFALEKAAERGLVALIAAML
jgi:hypothetical protein